MLTKSLLAVCAMMLVLAQGAAVADHRVEVEGTITAINRTATPPTIRIATGRTSVLVRVTSNTEIEVEDDERGTLDDLRTGQRVEAEFDRFTGEALKIEVEDRDEDDDDEDGDDDGDDDEDNDDEAEIAGTIVSATATELVLNVNGRRVTIGLDEQTRVRLNDVLIDVDDLASLVGRRAKVEFDRGTNVADKVKVEVPVSNLLGTVVSVGADTLTIRVGTRTITLEVPEETPIRFRDQRLELDDLLVGDVLRVQALLLEPLAGILLRAEVQAQERNATGTLSAVGASTITVLTRQGPVTLTVDGRTDLRVNGLRVTLAQLSTLLSQANAAGRLIQVSAQYIVRAGTSLATRVRGTIHFRRR